MVHTLIIMSVCHADSSSIKTGCLIGPSLYGEGQLGCALYDPCVHAHCIGAIRSGAVRTVVTESKLTTCLTKV